MIDYLRMFWDLDDASAPPPAPVEATDEELNLVGGGCPTIMNE